MVSQTATVTVTPSFLIKFVNSPWPLDIEIMTILVETFVNGNMEEAVARKTYPAGDTEEMVERVSLKLVEGIEVIRNSNPIGANQGWAKVIVQIEMAIRGNHAHFQDGVGAVTDFCRRCRGPMVSEQDHYGEYATCLYCGYVYEPTGNLALALVAEEMLEKKSSTRERRRQPSNSTTLL